MTERLAERLVGIELFADLDAEKLDWLADVGRQVSLTDGQVLFRDGEPALFFYVLLGGGLLMTKVFAGQEQVLSRHSAGPPDPDEHEEQDGKPSAANQFTGELPLLTGGDYVATATALGPTELVAYDRPAFFGMLERAPQISRVLMPVLAWRIHTHEVQAGRSVMLAGLGTLAAGLAHELNNPMSASVRGASRLRQVLPDLTECAVRWGALATEQERELLAAIPAQLADVQPAEKSGQQRSALEVSEATDLIDDWLVEHDVEEAEQAAETFAERGLDVGRLEQLLAPVRPEALATAIGQLALTLEADTLVDDVAEAARRVEELVLSTKDYTNMDRAPERDVDLAEGLEATLVLLGPELDGITVHRDYGELPPVPVLPSEINQVWMNLIKNAIDAMKGDGELRVTTCREGPCAVIEIRDSGPGIAADDLPCIFQPFFTTKDVGQATGLGLHLSRETVTTRHGGSIDVVSVPGDTRFTVRLPLSRKRPGGESGGQPAR